MSALADTHECEMVRNCCTDPRYRALFRGSLTPTCPAHARIAQRDYDADIYTADGEAADL